MIIWRELVSSGTFGLNLVLEQCEGEGVSRLDLRWEYWIWNGAGHASLQWTVMRIAMMMFLHFFWQLGHNILSVRISALSGNLHRNCAYSPACPKNLQTCTNIHKIFVGYEGGVLGETEDLWEWQATWSDRLKPRWNAQSSSFLHSYIQTQKKKQKHCYQKHQQFKHNSFKIVKIEC